MIDLRIAAPCHESWVGMTPDGRGRHCARCAKTVVDVTAMTPSAGRAFVAAELPKRLARGEHVCVRAHADTRGRLLRPGVRRYLLTNGLAAVLAMTLAGCGSEPSVITGGVEPKTQPAQAAPTSAPLMGTPAPVPPPEESPMMGSMAPPLRGEVAPVVEPEPAAVPATACVLGEAEAQTPHATALMRGPASLPEVMGDVALPPPR